MKHRPFLLTYASIGVGVLAALPTDAAETLQSIVLNIPGLVAFWDF